jgi:predicted site-specific integrase-resolvase
MEQFLTQKQTLKYLNISRMTLLRYEEKGWVHPIRTIGAHRRYKKSELNRLVGVEETAATSSSSKAFLYARVSTKKQAQAGNLDRQVQRLIKYANENEYTVNGIYQEIASGINERRQQLYRMLNRIQKQEVEFLIIEYKDRLARLGYSYLEQYCLSHGVSIILMKQQEEQPLNEEMVQDMVSIITSFSARIYGQRGARKVKQELSKLGEEARA